MWNQWIYSWEVNGLGHHSNKNREGKPDPNDRSSVKFSGTSIFCRCWSLTCSMFTFWWHPGLALHPHFNNATPELIEKFKQSLCWKGVGHWYVQWPYAEVSWFGVYIPIFTSAHFSFPLLVPWGISQLHYTSWWSNTIHVTSTMTLIWTPPPHHPSKSHISNRFDTI